MRSNIEIIWSLNGYTYLKKNGRVVYKSKDPKKVQARYENMKRLEEMRESRIPSGNRY